MIEVYKILTFDLEKQQDTVKLRTEAGPRSRIDARPRLVLLSVRRPLFSVWLRWCHLSNMIEVTGFEDEP